jgi:hypothetical protein
MNEQEILDNKPKGNFTNVSMSNDKPFVWACNNFRSLADIKELVELRKANAELEKELSSIVAGLFSENELAILKLEQQAKGCDWVLACRELNLSDGEIYTLMDKCNQLRNQAKALKEQDNEII